MGPSSTFQIRTSTGPKFRHDGLYGSGVTPREVEGRSPPFIAPGLCVAKPAAPILPAGAFRTGRDTATQP